MSKVFIEESTLTDIGDAIREKEGTNKAIPTLQMANRIRNLSTSDYPDELIVTGDCDSMFANDQWNGFIKYYNKKIKTSDINRAYSMFYGCRELDSIPFEINFSSDLAVSANGMFMNCTELKEIGKFSGYLLSDCGGMFWHCSSLRYLPEGIEDMFDEAIYNLDASPSSYDRAQMFLNCYSLREIPSKILMQGHRDASGKETLAYGGFKYCYNLDEIIGLKCNYNKTWTSNAFSGTVTNCSRLKDFTFNTPSSEGVYSVKWKSQTIDLSTCGYFIDLSDFEKCPNSGITMDKLVKDDQTYNSLKNDKDWFTTDLAYSRYNRVSALRTIKTLPDASAFLNGVGNNYIIFKGEAGSKTDGGAINTLTEQEKSIATKKGWIIKYV